MPEKPEEREAVTVEQIAMTNMYHLEALTELLEEAGIVTKEQVWSTTPRAAWWVARR